MGNFKTRCLPFGELPQNVVGRIVSRQWKKRLGLLGDKAINGIEELEKEHGVKIYFVTQKSQKSDKLLKGVSGFSLGKYICLNDRSNLTTVRHEIGHSIQSRKLKWLYLPVIGIWSAVFCNMWDRWFHQKWTSARRYNWYYGLDGNRWTWTERWADELGKAYR